ncbi:MAG: hypothetical protein Fur005_08830 [Roseiflexaceae bacterium]
MSISRRRLLALLPILAATGLARAEQQHLQARDRGWMPPSQPGRPSQPPQLSQTAPFLIHLPWVATAGGASVVRFYGLLGGIRSGPANQFGGGISGLAYEIDITGSAGLTFREEWFFNQQPQPQLSSTGIVPSDPATRTGSIVTLDGSALASGNYRLRFLVAEFVAADVQVIVGA